MRGGGSGSSRAGRAAAVPGTAPPSCPGSATLAGTSRGKRHSARPRHSPTCYSSHRTRLRARQLVNA